MDVVGRFHGPSYVYKSVLTIVMSKLEIAMNGGCDESHTAAGLTTSSWKRPIKTSLVQTNSSAKLCL
ncbi:hypothetical protein J6590_033017 [Homalodisca vitripennis]|nr:hypothetical protein J6590_033017 [Homalodisca vitripennis]